MRRVGARRSRVLLRLRRRVAARRRRVCRPLLPAAVLRAGARHARGCARARDRHRARASARPATAAALQQPDNLLLDKKACDVMKSRALVTSTRCDISVINISRDINS